MKMIDFIIRGVESHRPISQIAKDLGIGRWAVLRWMKKFGIEKPKKFNEDFFENIDTENKAYWLGFLFADGCVSRTQSPKVQINLSILDRHHIEKWHEAINSIVRVRCYGSKSPLL